MFNFMCLTYAQWNIWLNGRFFIKKNQHNWKQKGKIKNKTSENTKTKQKNPKEMCIYTQSP